MCTSVFIWPSKISEGQAAKLIENRVKFRIFAAEQHLKYLKNFEQQGNTMQSFKERIPWEMEIECFLFHIVGARDSLLDMINDKLALGLNERGVNMRTVEKKLTQRIAKSLLTDLKTLDNNTSFKILEELRHQSAHRKLINLLFQPDEHRARVFFILDPDKRLEIIPFLESGLQILKTSIQNTLANDSRLS